MERSSSLRYPFIMHVKFELPAFTAQQAERIAREFYGIPGTARELPSERDQNFYLQTPAGQYVLKIANVSEDRQVLEFQNDAIEHLARHAGELRIPALIRTTKGEGIAEITDDSNRTHFLRMLTFIPAKVFANVRPHSAELLQSLGHALGIMDRALQNFSHPAADRRLKWDLAYANWIRDYLHVLQSPERRSIVDSLLQSFEREVVSRFPSLRKSVIYNDANDYNILVESPLSVAGFIDFGDMLYSHTVCNLAVAIAYAMLHKPDPITAATHVLTGYHRTFPLTDDELRILFPLACMRLCITVVNAGYQREVEPGNAYLTISEQPAWETLQRLSAIPKQLAHYRFRFACGLSPSPASISVSAWLSQNAGGFAPVLSADMNQADVLDLSPGSRSLGSFDRMFERINQRTAPLAIGRYNEARVLLAKNGSFRVEGNAGPEDRTVHLGFDLFTAPGTAVYAPFYGVVHSFRNNAAPHDYGPTIILEHQTADAEKFYTLYGHLSLDSLNDLHGGKEIAKGRRIGSVGESYVNGGWPPHLHFQILLDTLDAKGDFPGNCTPALRAFWMSLCPDPNLIVRIDPERLRGLNMEKQKIAELRASYIGRSLSLAYQNPLQIVRGYMQHLYDEDGRAYLDCVNNVAHVGHCHPRVVKAGQEQMALLNTNTRYLHENLALYAERLCATLPHPLRVCFFVNSGSEANELALRLARAHTKRKEIMVLDAGYHGNTTALIEVSAYKFQGPGGEGRQPYVHVLPLPDLYRGLYRNPADAGGLYAEHVLETMIHLQESGASPGAFLCEPMPGVAGQIIFPEGYLALAYHYAREAGAVCIADEVQTGFGRPGTHFWGFETQGVVPDIVTMGKPIGNGHPMGAVVTTCEIAESFANGMEYFSTFGGNPVSCAIGLSVLDVIQEERLQENAQKVGGYLLARLHDLAGIHSIIGDVRGRGLYIGVELVKERESREPAADQASYVVNSMRDRAVLLSTDGPFHNVIKIKPPLVFELKDADLLVDTLQTVLNEEGALPK